MPIRKKKIDDINKMTGTKTPDPIRPTSNGNLVVLPILQNSGTRVSPSDTFLSQIHVFFAKVLFLLKCYLYNRNVSKFFKYFCYIVKFA